MLKKLFFWISSCCLLILLLVATYLFYLYTHKGFKPTDFKHPIVQEVKFSISLPNEETKAEVEQILNQKFSYLGFGKQMTAYVSEDQQYVIKFFNPRPPLKEKWFHSYEKLKYFCTFKWFSRAYFKKEERLNKIFKRHALAWNELKEETGLVYVHLNRLTALKQTIQVADQKGSIYKVNLEQVPFVLQRKVELAGDYLRRLHSLNDQQQIQQAFDQLRYLFMTRSRKGFTDRIQTLNNNYGFYKGKAVQIDFGRIWEDKQLNADEETEKILNHIKVKWPLFQNCL